MTIAHLADLLDRAAGSWPDDVFLRAANPMTFAELAAASHAVAAWLREHGIGAGDRVVIVTANHPESIAAAFGASRLGAIFTFLHHAIRPFGLRRIVEQLEPACVVLDDATIGLRSVFGSMPLLTAGGVDAQGATPLAKVIASRRRLGAENVPSDPCCLVYTSGSTGEPRGVVVSRDNVAFTVAAIQQRLGYRRGDVVGLFLPLSFDYGLYQVFLALAAGASVFIGASDFISLRLVEALAQERVSVLPGVPVMLQSLAWMLERAPRSLPHLRAVTNTGERLAASTLDRLRALLPGLDVFSMYGLTECKRVSILLPGELDTHPGSVGRPLDGTVAEVIGPDGSVLPDDTPGELVVRGPHVTMGYWRAPGETAQRFRVTSDGSRALYTGDTCRRSAGGYLSFEGRSDAQTKRRAFRISLLEIESAALDVRDIAGASAIAWPDSDKLHLFIAGGALPPSADTVIRALRERLEPHKIPDRVHVFESLPTTPHGKVDRRRLRALAEASSG
jgi:acyl-CoA synthetase (AMP-forming)/AMP-acid ligase II